MSTHLIFNQKVAEQLKLAREKAGKTQLDVLQDTGIHIGRIEQGKLSIQLFTFFLLCKYLNVNCFDIVRNFESENEIVNLCNILRSRNL
jgi:transcriptional regulator with XRE-family HTH domain